MYYESNLSFNDFSLLAIVYSMFRESSLECNGKEFGKNGGVFLGLKREMIDRAERKAKKS